MFAVSALQSVIFCCDNPSGLRQAQYLFSRVAVLFLSSLTSVTPGSLGLLFTFLNFVAASSSYPLLKIRVLQSPPLSPFLPTLRTPCFSFRSLGTSIGLTHQLIRNANLSLPPDLLN